MKKIGRVTIFTFLAVLLFSCQSSESDQIEKAAYGYLDAVANYDFDAAVPFVTPATDSITLDFFRKVLEHTDMDYVNSNKPATIQIKSLKKTADDTAMVFFHKTTPITEQDDTIRVVRTGGQWLIEINPFFLLMLNGANAEE